MPKRSLEDEDAFEEREDQQEEWNEEEEELEEDEDVEDEEEAWKEEETGDVEEPEVDEYDLTQLPGVNRDLAKKLKKEGFESLWDIAYADTEWIIEVKGVDNESAEKMIEAAKKLLKLD